MKKFFIFLCLIVLIIGAVTYFWLHGITKKIFIPRPKSSITYADTIDQDLKTKKPFNILLLGYGGGTHDGPYLTDSMIVARVDPQTQKIFLVSIPRDTWVKIPTNGTDGSYSKINAAYSDGLDDTTYPNKEDQFKGPDGGGRLAEYVVSGVTGLTINYFGGIDFSGFTHTIDTLGGVDITVQKTFDDYSYPVEGKEDYTCGYQTTDIASFSAQIATGSAQEWDIFPCRFEHLHFEAGPQHMDGATALKYVRSRHSLQDGTDFGRSERQRNLMVAVKQKVFSAGLIPKVIPFVSSLGDDARTDLTPDDVKTLIENANALNKYQVVSLALTDQNFLKNGSEGGGQAVLEPRDGIDNWGSVHQWLADEFSGKVQPVAATVLIENGTSTPGLALKATNKLKEDGVNTIDPTTASTKDNAKTVITIFDKNVRKSDIALLKKEFPTAVVSNGTSTDTSYNIRIVIGDDYTAIK